MALIELTQIKTADGLSHEAHVYPPAPGGDLAGDIGMAVVHGSGGNLALPWVRAYAVRFSGLGMPVLCANNRGHHVVWSGPRGMGYFGNAFERIDGCLPDLEAAVELLLARGVRRVVLVGHSLGGLKVIYYQGERAHPAVAGVISTSAVRTSYRRFLESEDADEFRGVVERAQALVAAGRPNEIMEVTHPIQSLYSAATYLDKHGPEEKGYVVKHVARITCPILLMGGSLETHSRLRDFPRELYEAATAAAARELHTIDGAGHDYADKMPIALDHAERWLRQTVLES